MSVVIGMHLGAYALIAADTRRTFYPPGGKPFFTDENVKGWRIRRQGRMELA